MAGGTLSGSWFWNSINWWLKDDLTSHGEASHDGLDQGLGEGDNVEVIHAVELLDDL